MNKTIVHYSVKLPDFDRLGDAIKKHIKSVLLDRAMQNDLDGLQVINWCRTIKRLYPVKTKGEYI